MGCCDGSRAFDLCTRNLPDSRFCGIKPPVDLQKIKVNLRETEDKLYVEAELPGFEKDDISILLADETLSISAEKNETSQHEGEYIRKESSHAKYQRSILLPFEADADSIKAYYDAGVLTVDIPKPSKENIGSDIEVN